MQQPGLFTKEDIKPVEPKTTVRLGRRSAPVSLARRRREATEKLKEALASLEGKDILISYCGGAHSHWWFDDLRLSHLTVHWGDGNLPGVVVLWGKGGRCKQQSLRVFLNRLVNVREQGATGS